MPSKLFGLWLILCYVPIAFGNSTVLGELASLYNNASLLGVILAGRSSVNSLFCNQSLELTADSIANGKDWALKIFDASGKLPSGLVYLPTVFLGSYEECLGVKIGESLPFQGQYCKVFFGPNNNQDVSKSAIDRTYRWDVCVPSTCTAEDINSSLARNAMISDLSIGVLSVECDSKEVVTMDASQVVAIVLFCFLGLFVLSGTAIDLVRRFMIQRNNSSARAVSTSYLDKLLTSFSLYSNACKVLDVSATEGSLTAINGIRFFSTTWIIMYHFFYFFNFFATKNVTQLFDMRFEFGYQIVLNSLVSVDTFFFISGLLVAYVNLRKLQKAPINWLEFYYHRYWRLTFPIAFVILFAFILPFLGSGPNWNERVSPDAKGCKKIWWTNLIYINNFYDSELPCFDHLWYLASDMQFYIVSPLIFYALHKRPKVGLFLNGFFLLATITISGILGTIYDLQPTTLFFMRPTTIAESFEKVYTKPYCRMGPYCVGIFVGYYLVIKKNMTSKPALQVTGWIVAFICCMLSLFGVYNWNRGNYGNIHVNSLYLATHRTVWSLGVAWMTLACATGNGGLINSFLSSKLFVPLSRLTYVAYLIHPMVIKGFVGYLRDTIVANQFLWVTLYLGLVCITFGLSFLVTLCIEVPFLSLEKLLFHASKPKQDKQDESSAISEKDISAVTSYNTMGSENRAFTMEN